MFQTSLHLLLVASLLSCPLRCSVHQAVSTADTGVQVVGCSCCGGCESESDRGQESSDCPDDGCDCGNCICHGAVIQNDAAAAVDLDFWVFLTPIEIRLSRHSTLRVRSEHVPLTTQRYLCGRDARIVHQSWLI